MKPRVTGFVQLTSRMVRNSMDSNFAESDVHNTQYENVILRANNNVGPPCITTNFTTLKSNPKNHN